MFQILVDGEILYDPLLANEGCDITSGTVDIELSKTGSATITIPSDNQLYDGYLKMKSIVEVFRDDEEIFRGRILHDERDFDNNKELYCEGQLAYMNDHFCPPYSFTNASIASVFSWFVQRYNEQTQETNKRFTVGSVTVTGTVTASEVNYTQLYDTLTAVLVDVYGGYVRVRYDPDVNDQWGNNGTHFIDYISDYENICEQGIEFGKNLMDFTENVSAEEVATVIVPLGAEKKSGDTVIGRVNLKDDLPGYGHEYVTDSNAQQIFGSICKIVTWDEVTDPNELYALAVDHLSKSITTATTITLRAIDLSLININYESIKVGDGIRVISEPHGIDDIFQCVKISYDILSPDNSEYEFGAKKKSITEQTNENTQNSSSASSSAATAEKSADNALIQARNYTDLEILKVTNAYESDETVITNKAALNGAWLRLIDLVDPQQYITSNGENRLKFGIIAEDLIDAMTQESFADQPIVSSIGGGRYSVSYDEIVALLWKKVQDLEQRVSDLES